MTVGVGFSLLTAIGSAAEIEIRLVRFSPIIPQKDEVARWAKEGLLGSATSYVASIEGDGAFAHSGTTPVAYKSIDKKTNELQDGTCDVGVSFSGRSIRDNGSFSVDLEFKRTEQRGIQILPIHDGTLFPFATFQSIKITTRVVITPGSKELAPIEFGSDSFLLVSIRD